MSDKKPTVKSVFTEIEELIYTIKSTVFINSLLLDSETNKSLDDVYNSKIYVGCRFLNQESMEENIEKLESLFDDLHEAIKDEKKQRVIANFC